MDNLLIQARAALPLSNDELIRLLGVSRSKFFEYQKPQENGGRPLPEYIANHCRSLLALQRCAPAEIEKLNQVKKAVDTVPNGD